MALEIEPVRLVAQLAVEILKQASPFGFFTSDEKRLTLQERQLELVKALSAAGIDPQLFDLLLSTELDRQLKARFGIGFFAATVVFTCVSYVVIIFNSVYKWGINDIAITGLVIETPLQFIGLLYIIARNLFPQTPPSHRTQASKPATQRSKPKSSGQAPSAQ
jgi:hypothetical protein